MAYKKRERKQPKGEASACVWLSLEEISRIDSTAEKHNTTRSRILASWVRDRLRELEASP